MWRMSGCTALRHAVQWGKLFFDTQSANGRRLVETVLSVIETCRRRDRDTFYRGLRCQCPPEPTLGPGIGCRGGRVGLRGERWLHPRPSCPTAAVQGRLASRSDSPPHQWFRGA